TPVHTVVEKPTRRRRAADLLGRERLTPSRRQHTELPFPVFAQRAIGSVVGAVVTSRRLHAVPPLPRSSSRVAPDARRDRDMVVASPTPPTHRTRRASRNVSRAASQTTSDPQCAVR